MQRLGLFLLKCLTGGLCLLLAATYLTGHLPPARWNILGLLGLCYPFLLLAVLCCAVAGYLLNQKWFWIVLAVVAAGCDCVFRYVGFLPRNLPDNTTQTIKLVTYNVGSYSKWYGDQRHDDMTDFLKGTDADIICLEEASGDGIYAVLKKRFPDHPYQQIVTNQNVTSTHVAVLSRFKMVGHGQVPLEEHSLGAAFYTDLLAGHDTIRLYALHLQSFLLDKSVTTFIDTLSLSDSDKIDWHKVKDIADRLQRGFIKRAPQAESVAAHIAASPHPVIVCGDFNDTPVSYTYQQIRGKLHDAFRCSGRLAGGTFRIHGSYAVRIDYCLFDKQRFSALSYQSPRLTLSDHYPVVCTLVTK